MNEIRKKLTSKLKHKATHNSFWIVSESAVSVGITAVITILSARYLGAADYGILNYGLTLATLFLAIMKLGLDSIAVNELIKNRKKEGEVLGTSLVLRVLASVISIVSIAVLLMIINAGQTVLIIVALIQSVVLIFQAFYIFDYWFQSHLLSKYVSIAKIAATLLMSIYGVYLLLTDKGVVWFSVSTVLISVIVAILLVIFYFKQGGQPLKYSSNTAKYLLSKSHHFIIANIMSLIYVQIDKVMIGNMLDEVQLGLYSAAVMACGAWSFLPHAITTSMRPVILSLYQKSKRDFMRRLKQLYFMIFWISMVFSAMLALTAPWLIPFLFGGEYVDSVLIVQVMVWAMPFSFLGMARGIWIVAEDKNKYVKYYLFVGVVVNIVLNMILIPRMGILGAAVSTLVTELSSCLAAPLFFRATRAHPKIVVEAIRYNLK